MEITKAIQDSIETKRKILESDKILSLIKQSADLCIETFKENGKVLLCGNGGSAADAQHIAAELSGRFYYDREPLYAEALSVNTSYITAVSNDYSYDMVFSRMVKAAGRKGDVLIGLSTSGNSANVVNAIQEANKLGMKTIGFTGESEGKLNDLCDICIKIPSLNTARIQESHILIGHIICEIVEGTLFPQ
jgi:D-sedoheptulose 7-phosphate isomerase